VTGGPSTSLHGLLDHAAHLHGDHVAVVDPGRGAITYGNLAALSDRVRDMLVARGVQRGDRVGIYLTKSVEAIVALFGALKAGAAYVPIDPNGPPARNAYILADCAVKVSFVERRLADGLRSELGRAGHEPPHIVVVESPGDGSALAEAVRLDAGGADVPESSSATPQPTDLAYILYTSGSTGRPKGVMLSHENGLSYVDWCSDVFHPAADDRFSSHAPLHFDLSILDVFVPLKHGATLVLVDHDAGKDPVRLARLIADTRLTVWYSAPSILSLMAQHGELSSLDYSALRLVLFAGEVFPIKHLRSLKKQVPHPAYFNLYGPTETNVCTYFRIPERIPDDRAEPYPIGRTCEQLESRVLDDEGVEVPRGSEGELWIAGPNVMQGYWGCPERTAESLVVDDRGRRWYRTGDIVAENSDGDFDFRGRRDRMIKKRGYRVELGEIEACLYAHPDVREAAVVARPGQDGVEVRAYLSLHTGERLSLIALKRFCSERLPLYMIPDTFTFLADLPKTSTAKVDYQGLRETVTG
jgi:amino acid adenylation domain-containing protein